MSRRWSGNQCARSAIRNGKMLFFMHAPRACPFISQSLAGSPLSAASHRADRRKMKFHWFRRQFIGERREQERELEEKKSLLKSFFYPAPRRPRRRRRIYITYAHLYYRNNDCRRFARHLTALFLVTTSNHSFYFYILFRAFCRRWPMPPPRLTGSHSAHSSLQRHSVIRHYSLS